MIYLSYFIYSVQLGICTFHLLYVTIRFMKLLLGVGFPLKFKYNIPFMACCYNEASSLKDTVYFGKDNCTKTNENSNPETGLRRY